MDTQDRWMIAISLGLLWIAVTIMQYDINDLHMKLDILRDRLPDSEPDGPFVTPPARELDNDHD